MQGVKEVDVRTVLERLQSQEGVVGYVIFDKDCIPLKWDSIEYEQAVQYAALISNLSKIAKKNIGELTQLMYPSMTPEQNPLEVIRIRTLFDTELIISTSQDYTIICIQICNKEKLAQEMEKRRLIQEKLDREKLEQNEYDY